MDRAETSQLRLSNGRLLFAGLAGAVFVLDRITKGLVAHNVTPGTERAALPGVWITNTQNAGAAFGLAQQGTTIFLFASIVVSIGLLTYAVRNRLSAWNGALLGLILGGTLGNGYDRLFHGSVTDFIALHFWPVFNVADSAISVGVAMLLAGYLLRRTGDES